MVLEELERVILDRAGTDPSESYTARLLEDSELNRRKIMEEAFEVCLELGRGAGPADPVDRGRIAEEAADLVYHLMVALAGAGVEFGAVTTALEERRR